MTSSDLLPVLRRLMVLMTSPGTALDYEPLQPDGKYQTRRITLGQLTQEVADRLSQTLRTRSAEDLPTLLCSWGKCRVGSTALTNLFGIAGVPAFYQPVKTMARHRLLDSEPRPWDPPKAAEHSHIFSKEMAGPYLAVETIFNPLEILVAAGYPTEKLHLVIVDREPYASLASWIARWSDRVPRARLVGHFALSSLQVRRMRAFAYVHGVATTHYAYEASRRPQEAIEALFGRLGILGHFRPGVVSDWKERGAIESAGSGVNFPEEPPVYVVPGLHSSETEYRYIARDTIGLFSGERDLIEELGLPGLYRQNVAACVKDLSLEPSLAVAMFGSAAPVALPA